LASALGTVVVSSAGAAPAIGDARFSRAAVTAVERIEREDGFSGIILVARGDQVLLRKAAGFADRERNIPNTPDAKFPIESVTKQFTAAAIMLLVQDGKLSLADPISKYYPASPATWKDVRIKHLLTHSSGIEDYWIHRPDLIKDEKQLQFLFHSYEDYFRLPAGDPLGFAPGKGFAYSNAGYALLAAVIEHASGQSYAEFLRRRVFAPLEMRNTGVGRIPGEGVKGYLRAMDPASPGGEWRRGRFWDAASMAGFGGIYATLDDMLVWSRALETNDILSPASKTAIYADYGYNYGFGWRFAPKFGRKLIWHTGNDEYAGFASIFDRFPEEQLTVVVMTNNTGLIDYKASLLIEGNEITFQANAARKAVEEVERLYFGRAP
jgi:CubicO group peptidase (beta-lactamase class C family)